MPGPAFLRGERVDLCTIELDDADFLQATINDPRVWGSLGMRDPVSGHEEREWIESAGEDGDVHLLVCDDGERLGMVGLTDLGGGSANTAEVGYWLHPDHHGQGYATEAVELLVSYGFDQHRLHRVRAKVYDFNEASRRVLERLGFVEEGVRREASFVDGEYVEVIEYGVLEDEWRAREES